MRGPTILKRMHNEANCDGTRVCSGELFRVVDKAIRAECKAVTQNVTALLTPYDVGPPGGDDGRADSAE